MKVVIKSGFELNSDEINQINQNKLREFKALPLNNEQLKNSLFFLLKTGQNILAQGQLVKIPGVRFNNENFQIMGIGGIISNIQGQSNGKKLMEGIREYLKNHDLIGVGFTGDKIIEFYQKSGFLTDKNSLSRFAYLNNGQKITNTTEDWVFYQDSQDQMLKKILASNQEVILPRTPDW